MISITSDGDWATKKIMPYAQWIPSLALRFRKYDDNCGKEGQLCLSQRYYYRHSEASLGEMRTHLVIPAKDVTSCDLFPVPWPYFKVGTCKCFCVHDRRDPNPTDECGADANDRKNYFGSDPLWNDTPFYVMGVSPSLINGHNDIFQEGTVELLRAISRQYGILFQSTGPRMMTSPMAARP
jgi:hypothetical protein